MRRARLVLYIAFIFAATANVCNAQSWGDKWHNFWHRTKVDFHRNNAYPEPFRYHDRQIVRTAYDPYIAKGWQVENTLSPYEFNEQTGELTPGGYAKVLWIATQAPVQRRTIFVQQGETQEATEKRIDQVQQAVAKVLPKGRCLPWSALTEDHAV